MAATLELETLLVRIIADATMYNRVMNSVESRHASFMSRMNRVGNQLSYLVTLPLSMMGLAALRAFANFDEGMTKSLAIMKGVTPEMRAQMEGLIVDISSQSITAPAKLAEAYYFLASAGLDAARMMGALPIVERFSVAGAFDLDRATQYLTQSQAALGLQSEDAAVNLRNLTRISDVLSEANIMAQGTTEQFADALRNKAANALRFVNKSVEEGVALLAVFAERGIVGRQAGEMLAITLRELQRASLAEKSWKAWDELGIRVYDANGIMLHTSEIIRQLEDQFDGLSDRAKRLTLQRLGFQERSMSGILALLGSSGKIREFEDRLRSAGGATDRIANEQMKSFSAQMAILWNNITLVGIEIGRLLAPWITRLNDLIYKAIRWWRELNPGIKQVILGLLGFATAASLVVFILVKIGLIVGAMTAALGVAAYAFLFLGAVATMAVSIFKLFGFRLEDLGRGWEVVRQMAETALMYIVGFLYNVVENSQRFFTWLTTNWDFMWADILEGVITFSTNVGRNIGIMVEVIVKLISGIGLVFLAILADMAGMVITFGINSLRNFANWVVLVARLFWTLVKAWGSAIANMRETFMNWVRGEGPALRIEIPHDEIAQIRQEFNEGRRDWLQDAPNLTGRVIRDMTNEAREQMNRQWHMPFEGLPERRSQPFPEFNFSLPPDVRAAVSNAIPTRNPLESMEDMMDGVMDMEIEDKIKKPRKEKMEDVKGPGDTFKAMSLARFIVGGNLSPRPENKEQKVKAPGVEDRLDELIKQGRQGQSVLGY